MSAIRLRAVTCIARVFWLAKRCRTNCSSPQDTTVLTRRDMPAQSTRFYPRPGHEGRRPLSDVRQVKDTNHYEMYPDNSSALRTRRALPGAAIVRVTDVQKDTAIAAFELSCADVMPGDLAIPLPERQAPPFRKVALDHYTPPSGKPQGGYDGEGVRYLPGVQIQGLPQHWRGQGPETRRLSARHPYLLYFLS